MRINIFWRKAVIFIQISKVWIILYRSPEGTLSVWNKICSISRSKLLFCSRSRSKLCFVRSQDRGTGNTFDLEIEAIFCSISRSNKSFYFEYFMSPLGFRNFVHSFFFGHIDLPTRLVLKENDRMIITNCGCLDCCMMRYVLSLYRHFTNNFMLLRSD